MLLHTFCHTFKDQVAKRVYFYKSASELCTSLFSLDLCGHTRCLLALVRRGIIKIRKADADLLDLTVTIDRRILDWVVGLDTEISELVEGSNLYTPKVGRCSAPKRLHTRLSSFSFVGRWT